ncbi:Gfo/Idh/MocA family protein [Microbacterium sp. 22242]|uniref:Gfo/Idh/MocA family protein n=1 Tax=Microbacterium sp. 22242 TaxID=3453896 RepID=UPI003F8559C5
MNPPTSRPYRAAIIGTGGIARVHAKALKALAPRIELVAVADVDPDRARAFAAEFAVPSVHTDAAALLAGHGLDLVSICTPPQSHAPLAALAQRAGVVPLVEKPTTLNLRELDELRAVEEETGVPVLTVFQHRFGAAGRLLARLVAEGGLGRPQVATCETLWYRDDAYFGVPWRGRWDVEGGGPTMGHGIHQFDLLLAILGPWAEVTAFAARQSRPTDTEDVSLALARFENGALATVVNSVVSPRESSRLRFDFEFATVEVEHVYGYTTADWTFTPAPGHEELAALWQPDATGGTSGHGDQLAAILDAFDAGTPPEASLTQARRTLEFAAATYASAFRGRPIAAGEIGPDDPFAATMSGGMVPWAPLKEALV